jgi:hypothetical protein
MTERLGLAVIPGVGWTARELQTIAREAEDAGLDAIFAAEVNKCLSLTGCPLGHVGEPSGSSSPGFADGAVIGLFPATRRSRSG